jgi:GAF domain-containing protein
MAEQIHFSKAASKQQIYEELLPQIQALISTEKNLIANLANISAALKQAFNWWWVGFYWVEEEELVLGPFQGPIACTRIKIGKGVCGTAWQKKETIIVPNVDLFPGHIACSAASKSEIVVPIFNHNHVVGVLDCDSEYENHFDETDRIYLEKLAQLISQTLCL